MTAGMMLQTVMVHEKLFVFDDSWDDGVDGGGS